MSKEKAALTLLDNNRSWESIRACIELGVFDHVNWNNQGALILKLAEKVQERSGQDKKASSIFWNALRHNNVPADLQVEGAPLWKCCLFGKRFHIFKAMVEKNDIPTQDLQSLTLSQHFQICVLQAKEWGVLIQISSPTFEPIKQWAEEYRKENLWMLSSSMGELYKARPDFKQEGVPVTEIKRWATSWAKSAHKTPTQSTLMVSPLVFSCDYNQRYLADQLDDLERKSVIEQLNAEGWGSLIGLLAKDKSDWLHSANCDVSLSTLTCAFGAWKQIYKGVEYGKEQKQSVMRLFLKRAARQWIKTNPTQSQEMFQNLLSLWDGVAVQKEEAQILYDFMKNTPQLSTPWTWKDANASHIAIAVAAFLSLASDEEIQKHSREICEFILHAAKDQRHNDNATHIVTQNVFEILKNRDGENSARPYLAQMLWMSTFLSPNKALLQRCSRWNGLKKAEEFRPNLKVFYPPVYEDLMTQCLDKMQTKKMKPEERALVEKTCLEYHMSAIALPPASKTTRKM